MRNTVRIGFRACYFPKLGSTGKMTGLGNFVYEINGKQGQNRIQRMLLPQSGVNGENEGPRKLRLRDKWAQRYPILTIIKWAGTNIEQVYDTYAQSIHQRICDMQYCILGWWCILTIIKWVATNIEQVYHTYAQSIHQRMRYAVLYTKLVVVYPNDNRLQKYTYWDGVCVRHWKYVQVQMPRKNFDENLAMSKNPWKND